VTDIKKIISRTRNEVEYTKFCQSVQRLPDCLNKHKENGIIT